MKILTVALFSNIMFASFAYSQSGETRTYDTPQSEESFSLQMTIGPDGVNPAIPYGNGVRAFKEGRYLEAKTFFQEATTHGLFAGSVYLAEMNDKGIGIPVNKAAARYYHQKAIEQGENFNLKADIAPSIFSYGQMLEKGEGGAQDYYQALSYYIKAGDYGYPVGYLSAAQIHHNDRIDGASINEACRLYNMFLNNEKNMPDLIQAALYAVSKIPGNCR